MIERYQPELWIHGHMHDPVDERLGRTRLLANPAGYRYEAKRGFDPRLCMDMDKADAKWCARHSGSKWTVSPGGQVARRTRRAGCRSRGAGAPPPGWPRDSLAPLSESTFRYTWMMATHMRGEMLAGGCGEELEALIAGVRALQDELLDKAPDFVEGTGR